MPCIRRLGAHRETVIGVFESLLLQLARKPRIRLVRVPEFTFHSIWG
jgi:hypothetical protein